jgi:SAM-dependent methyltransferase
MNGETMGIGPAIVRALIREHQFKPIRGDVRLIGRQTVYFTPQKILKLLTDNGVDTTGIDPDTIALDRRTVDRRAGFADATLITDAALFKLFGVDKVLALDWSDYEKADIIHDLRTPLPAKLYRTADLVVDGSTLDNVFTPSVALQNFSRLLRPGGRMLTFNAFSSYGTPYAIMPPMWYVDYFVMNRFADCRVYIIVYRETAANEFDMNVFNVDLTAVKNTGRGMGRFCAPYNMVTLVFAEKDAESTDERLPIQQDYRSTEDWDVYNANLTRMLESKRPHLVASRSDRFVMEPAPGHSYIDKDYQARP